MSSGGSGTAGSGSAGTSSAGTTGGTGCDAPAWISGFNYKSGDMTSGACNNGGGGSTVCTVGKKYAWTCFGSTCAIYAPGADGWWANWTVGAECN
jgi:hypothetical protein